MTLLLYAATVLIWGTTWIMMKYQLGVVAPEASLTYRYLAAGLIVLAGSALFRDRIRFTAREHRWLALQGLLMFSVNFWMTYEAAYHLTTGIIAVIFSSASVFTMAVSAILFKTMPSARAMVGACLGIVGIGLVFWPELSEVSLAGPEVRAGLVVLVSLMMFAFGGLVGARNQRAGFSTFGSLGWAMFYGGLIMAAITILRGKSFGFDPSFVYVGSLIYITLLGSTAVFVLYFSVIKRIGAEKASYATVLFPLVALTVSTYAEDYHWPVLALIGVPLALFGNAMVLWKKSSPAPGRGMPSEPDPIEGPINIVEFPEDDLRILSHKT